MRRNNTCCRVEHSGKSRCSRIPWVNFFCSRGQQATCRPPPRVPEGFGRFWRVPGSFAGCRLTVAVVDWRVPEGGSMKRLGRVPEICSRVGSRSSGSDGFRWVLQPVHAQRGLQCGTIRPYGQPTGSWLNVGRILCSTLSAVGGFISSVSV